MSSRITGNRCGSIIIRSTPRRRRAARRCICMKCPVDNIRISRNRRPAWACRTAGRRSRACTRRSTAVRRHRQGDAVQQGGGRHGAVPLQPGHQAGGRGQPGAGRAGFPGIGGGHAERRAGLAGGRLAGGFAAGDPWGKARRPGPPGLRARGHPRRGVRPGGFGQAPSRAFRNPQT